MRRWKDKIWYLCSFDSDENPFKSDVFFIQIRDWKKIRIFAVTFKYHWLENDFIIFYIIII